MILTGVFVRNDFVMKCDEGVGGVIYGRLLAKKNAE